MGDDTASEEQRRQWFEERNTSPFVVEIDGKVVYDPFNNPEHAKERPRQKRRSKATKTTKGARKRTTTPPPGVELPKYALDELNKDA